MTLIEKLKAKCVSLKLDFDNFILILGLSTNKHSLFSIENIVEDSWKKCCDECAFRKNPKALTQWEKENPNKKGPRIDHFLDKPAVNNILKGDLPFFCLHRIDKDEKFRVCGGWSAKCASKTPAE